MFVLAFDNTDNDNKKVERECHRKYVLPRVNITNCNVFIDARNLYDQPIGDQIKKCGQIRKIATGQGDDYITGRIFFRLSILQRSLSNNCIRYQQTKRI